MPASTEFKDWALGYGGCDGGDIGAPQSPSIWVCGIEWAGDHEPNELRPHMQESARTPSAGHRSWQHNIRYIFNWQVMKLLAAMSGLPVTKYKQFAEDAKPFVDGGVGYFKMNLYPIAFRNTSHEHWRADFSEVTGFCSKSEYLEWCNAERLPQICQWARTHVPEVVICLGKTFRTEFGLAFAVPGKTWSTETIDERELSWALNEHGTLVVLLPFMVNRNGLIRNLSIQKFGARIAQLRKAKRSKGTFVEAEFRNWRPERD